MTQSYTIRTCTLSVAFLIPARLSFAQGPGANAPDGFEGGAAAVNGPRLRCFTHQDSVPSSREPWRDEDTPVSGRLLNTRPMPWLTRGPERSDALNSMPQSRSKSER